MKKSKWSKWFTLDFQATIGTDQEADLIQEAQEYLRQFGYLKDGFTPKVLDPLTQDALQVFQRRRHLADTGKIDLDTVREIEKPRCGMPDLFPDRSESGLESLAAARNCSFRGEPELRYAIIPSEVHNLDQGQIEDAVDEAFRKWAWYIPPIQFKKVELSDCHHFELGWFKGIHTIGATLCDPFDGRGPVVGHAFHRKGCVDREELAGQCHFDDDETWGLSAVGSVIDFPTLVLHEIGHLIGLTHVCNTGAVMFEEYPREERRWLQPADIDAVQRLYGFPRLHLDVVAHFEGIEIRKFRDNEFIEFQENPRRLRGFELRFAESVPELRLRYMVRMDNRDLPFVGEGEFIGTSDPAQAGLISGFAIKLIGPQAHQYDVCYLAKIQDVGTTDTYRNGDFCGHRDQSNPVEAILVRVEPKS